MVAMKPTTSSTAILTDATIRVRVISTRLAVVGTAWKFVNLCRGDDLAYVDERF